MRNSQMLTTHPSPLALMTPDEMHALVQKAHAERAAALRDFILALFRQKPKTARAEHEQPLQAAACH